MEYKLTGYRGNWKDDERKIRDGAKKNQGKYHRTVLIGLGGTGAKSLQEMRRIVIERYGSIESLKGVAYLSIDTDITSQAPAVEDKKVDLKTFEQRVKFKDWERCNVKANFKDIFHRMEAYPHISEWMDNDTKTDAHGIELETGAGQIRPLSRLVFFQEQKNIARKLESVKGQVMDAAVSDPRLISAEKGIRVVIVAGLGGGTGSGMFLDVAALVRRVFDNTKTEIEGIFVMADAFKGVEKDSRYPKIAANTYAALREMCHFYRLPFEVQWDSRETAYKPDKLYNRYILLSGSNFAGSTVATEGNPPTDIYRSIGESLFLRFGEGELSGFIESVRVNRQQYLNSSINLEETVQGKQIAVGRWHTFFSTFGISKLVFPGWRYLNYARYSLAKMILERLNPNNRAGGGADGAARLKATDFLWELKVLQGERVQSDSSTRKERQIEEGLAAFANSDTNASTIFVDLKQKIVGFKTKTQQMFEDKDVERVARETYNALMGMLAPTGARGPWASAIVRNRQNLASTIRADIPRVLEDLSNARRAGSENDELGLGPAEITRLLVEVKNMLESPAVQNRGLYTDTLMGEVEDLKARCERYEKEFQIHIKNAADASNAWFKPSLDNFGAAVDNAAKTLEELMKARVDISIKKEAIEFIKQFNGIIDVHLKSLDKLSESLVEAASQYDAFVKHYSKVQNSLTIRELETDVDLDTILDPFIGIDARERDERLAAVFNRSLANMNLDSLEKLQERVNRGTLENFTEGLAAQTFLALHGEDSGKTIYFNKPGEVEPKDGFLLKYSLASQIEHHWPKWKSQVEHLYKMGMPWMEFQKSGLPPGTSISTGDLHKDAFMGFHVPGDEARPINALKEIARISNDFVPIQVKIKDPFEIVFYTEVNAFPAYLAAPVHGQGGFSGHYSEIQGDSQALHIHKDYPTFQGLVPPKQQEIGKTRHAWKVFVASQMLGIICSEPMDGGKRHNFIRRKRYDAETSFTRLGIEGTTLETLKLGSDDTTDQWTKEEEDISPKHLAALADYYRFCIFPRVDVKEKQTESTETRSSFGELVCEELGREWRLRAEEEDPDLKRDVLDKEIGELIKTIHTWARPVDINLRKGKTVDQVSVPSTLKEESYSLDPNYWERDGIIKLMRHFNLKRVRQRDDRTKDVEVFPRLAVDWDRIKALSAPRPQPVPQSPPPPVEKAYFVASNGVTLGKRGINAIVQLLNANPNDRIQIHDGHAWKRPQDVPDVAAQLQGPASVPISEPQPPPPPVEKEYDVASKGARLGRHGISAIVELFNANPKDFYILVGQAWKRPQDVPDVAAQLEERFRYACNGKDLGELPKSDIVERVVDAPQSKHYVLVANAWVAALEEPSLAMAIQEELARRAPAPPPPGGDADVPPPPGGDADVPPPPGGDADVPPPPGEEAAPPPPPGEE